MKQTFIKLSREAMRLKIKRLLKRKITDENPLLIEFLLNTITYTDERAKNFEMASIGVLDKEYKSVGEVVNISLSKLNNWSTKDALNKMLEDPDEYCIDVENQTIMGIIVECYYYDEYYDYCVCYPFYKEGEFTENLIDLKESDL